MASTAFVVITILALGFACGTTESAVLKALPSSSLPSRPLTHIHIMQRQKSVPVTKSLSSTSQQSTLTTRDAKDSPPVSVLASNTSYWRNIPNVLSILRLAAIPLFTISFLAQNKNTVTSLFVISSLTDFLDGYIARKYNFTSEFGAFLDPVADKLQVVTSLLLLLYNLPMPWIVLPVMVIILRELTVSSLREWLAGRHLRHLVKVSNIGKAKTATQMISLTLLLLVLPLPVTPITMLSKTSVSLWGESLTEFAQNTPFAIASLGITQDFGRHLFKAGLGLFYVSTLLTVLSGWQYLQAAWPVLMRKHEETLQQQLLTATDSMTSTSK